MVAPKGWLIAAPRSGSGKTTVTLGLVAALRRRGVDVATAKSGPDYIDTAFHAAASGRAGCNLDSWAMPPALLDGLMADAGADVSGDGLVIVESAMGLFDGIAGAVGRTGASADLAARFGLPVLLVLDVSGQSQTAAAVALGMDRYRAGVRVGGVVLNRVGSARHRAFSFTPDTSSNAWIASNTVTPFPLPRLKTSQLVLFFFSFKYSKASVCA